MDRKTTMAFFLKLTQKMHLPVSCIKANAWAQEAPLTGLPETKALRENTVYSLQDESGRRYTLLRLDPLYLMWIGPYVFKADHLGARCGDICVLPAEHMLYAMVSTLTSFLWGGEALRVQHVCVPQSPTLPGAEAREADRYAPIVRQVMRRIDTGIAGDLSLRAHAQALGVNASYLSALFRRETGMTLTEYVCRRRMEYAGCLLADTQMQVQAIAQQCGFADVNYFTRTFHRVTGKTPTQYRQRLQTMDLPGKNGAKREMTIEKRAGIP